MDGDSSGAEFDATAAVLVGAPAQADSPNSNIVLGLAWYRPEQWSLLRSLAVDSDKLEETYDEWLAVANKGLDDLRCKGISARKVDVDVRELSVWCKSRGCPFDAEARAGYVSEKLSHRSTGSDLARD